VRDIESASTTRYLQQVEKVRANVARVLIGKEAQIDAALTCLLAGGHLLIEDVPGIGKTSLARALAASLSLTANRIQFTPDLLPTDITGVTIFHQGTGRFEFRQGPIFANLVLADEINRASPKTQAALLEVMEEGTVSTDAMIYPVPKPFMVIATQNPIDMEGTYRLPEAEIDRFLMRTTLGYPPPDAEELMLEAHGERSALEGLKPVLGAPEIVELLQWVREIRVSAPLRRYVVAIVQGTRDAPETRLGVSPRGSLALLRAAKAHAALEGREFVVPDDVKAVAHDVLGHRILVLPSAEMKGFTATLLVERILERTPVPRGLEG